MKNPIILISLCFLLMSCASEKKIKNRDLMKIDSSLDRTFSNKDFTKQNKTLTSLFEMNRLTDKEINLSFDKEGDLKISYKDALGGDRFRCFNGKFKRNFFEVYLEKKRIPFPPIYWITQVNRLRISLDKENNLIIDSYFNHSGMILMMAAGSSNKEQFIFKPIIK
ncbi:MAG: hypothetical protein ABIQ27_01840 [Flavobacterium sp.]|uniref:hypothetical protein n=1 Tax=Flavobacterium sp. TaxID=239 RepID=UPI003267F8CD